MEFVLPEWLYRGVLDRRLVLAIDPAYFALTGGIELWLYRIAQARRPPTRRMALRTRASPYQERELGAVLRLRARYSRRIVTRQLLPGYAFALERHDDRRELMVMRPSLSTGAVGKLWVSPVDIGTSGAPSGGTGPSSARMFGYPTRFADPDIWTSYARNNGVNEQLGDPLICRSSHDRISPARRDGIRGTPSGMGSLPPAHRTTLHKRTHHCDVGGEHE